MKSTYRLRLYVTGGTHSAELAIAVLRKLTIMLAGRIQSQVIDVLLHPELFFDNGLQMTPLFVRECPDPVVRLRGEISEPQQLIRLLRLEP